SRRRSRGSGRRPPRSAPAPRTCPNSLRTGTRKSARGKHTGRYAHPASLVSATGTGAMHRSTVVIGAGRVGTVAAARLGARLFARGEDPDLGGCRLLLIATPDAAIAEVCNALAPRLEPGAGVVHFSGGTSVAALASAPGPRASVHPLQTIWPDRGPDQLEGAHAAVTGDWELGAGLARALGMTPFPLADEATPPSPCSSAPASSGRRRWPPCGRCSTARSTSPARRRPGRSPAATPPPSPPTCARSAPSSSRSTARSAAPPCPW